MQTKPNLDYSAILWRHAGPTVEIIAGPALRTAQMALHWARCVAEGRAGTPWQARLQCSGITLHTFNPHANNL